jgi:hypothetical protein
MRKVDDVLASAYPFITLIDPQKKRKILLNGVVALKVLLMWPARPTIKPEIMLTC